MMDLSNLESVQESISKIEAKTSAEIVVSVIKKSGTYDQLFALIFFLLLAVGLLLGLEGWIYKKYLPFEWNPRIAVAVVIFMCGAAAAWISRASWALRFFTTSATRDRWVQLRAEVEFFEEVKGRTRDHTGVLIFVSLAEHRAIILADGPIFALVPQKSFDEAMGVLMNALRAGHLAQGLSSAVEAVGAKLVSEFPVKGDDRNEVSDHVLVKES